MTSADRRRFVRAPVSARGRLHVPWLEAPLLAEILDVSWAGVALAAPLSPFIGLALLEVWPGGEPGPASFALCVQWKRTCETASVVAIAQIPPASIHHLKNLILLHAADADAAFEQICGDVARRAME